MLVSFLIGIPLWVLNLYNQDMIWYEYNKIWRGGSYYSKQGYFVCSVQIFMFMV